MTTIRTTVVSVGIVALLLGSTGCAVTSTPSAPSASQETGTATASPPASAPTTASASPTSTPTPDPSGPATWLFGASTFGPVRLGTDARTTLLDAGFTLRADSETCPAFFEWSSTDLSSPTASGYRVLVTADESGPGVRYVRVGGQASDTTAFSSPPLTTAGIALGSTADEVRAAYPDLVETVDTWEAGTGGHREYVTQTVDGNWLHFDTTGGDAADDVVSTVVLDDTRGSLQDVCG